MPQAYYNARPCFAMVSRPMPADSGSTSFFGRLRERLARSATKLTGDFASLFRGRRIDAELLDEAPSTAKQDDDFLLSAEPLELGELETLPVAEQPASVADDEWSFDLDDQPAAAPEPHGRAEDELWSLDELQSDLEPVDAEPTVAELPALDLPNQGFEEQPLELESLDLDAGDEPQWNEVDLDELQLPEVELPGLPEAPVVEEPAAEKPLSMADVMAAPVQAINPPAARSQGCRPRS